MDILEKFALTQENEIKTENRITRLLQCLESGNYSLAIIVADTALKDAEFIEQRLTIMYLKQIALNAKDELTEEILRQAYNYKGDK